MQKHEIGEVIMKFTVIYYGKSTIINPEFIFMPQTSNVTKTRLFKYTENFTTKKWKFSDKNSDVFHISAQNYDCGRRGGSNEYPQSMFLSKNKKNNVYPCKPQFYYIKMWLKEVKII